MAPVHSFEDPRRRRFCGIRFTKPLSRSPRAAQSSKGAAGALDTVGHAVKSQRTPERAQVGPGLKPP